MAVHVYPGHRCTHTRNVCPSVYRCSLCTLYSTTLCYSTRQNVHAKISAATVPSRCWEWPLRKTSTMEHAQTPASSNVVANEILHMPRIVVGFTMPPRYNQLFVTRLDYGGASKAPCCAWHRLEPLFLHVTPSPPVRSNRRVWFWLFSVICHGNFTDLVCSHATLLERSPLSPGIGSAPYAY